MIPPKEQIPPIHVTIPYYVVAAVCFFLLSVMCLLAVPAFTGHYFQPCILAVTHLAVLGWATTIIFGASNQLAPVVSERKLYNEKLPLFVLPLLIAGTAALVTSFYFFSFGLLTYIGSCFVLLAMIVQVINICQTFLRGKGGIVGELIVTAHAWLLLTAGIGFTLLLNLRFAFLSQDHLHYLRLHAGIGMAGWFLQLIIGVSARLLPMFLLSRTENTRLLNITYYLSNAGLLLFLVNGIWIQSTWLKNISYLLLLNGVLFYARYVFLCYSTALRKQMDQGMKQTFVALVLMSIPFILLLILVSKDQDYTPYITTAFGFSFFGGFISTLIMGQTFKTLPFIVWMHITSPNKLPEVMPKDLFNEQWVKAHMLLYLPGFLLFLSGILLQQVILLYTGSALMVIACGWYLLHVCLIITKLKRHA